MQADAGGMDDKEVMGRSLPQAFPLSKVIEGTKSKAKSQSHRTDPSHP